MSTPSTDTHDLPELGENLTTAPPVLSAEEMLDLVQIHWGMTGNLSALTSERDLNFRMTSPKGHFVVKLSNPAEPRAVTRFQTRALLHLESAPLALPRVIATPTGETEIETPHGILRLFSWLEGQPLYQAPKSDAQRAAIGQAAAQLTLGLQDFTDPAARQDLQWDIRHAARLRPLLPSVPDDLRPLCTEALDRFEAEALPHLAECRWQVVHNDLNPHNILVLASDPTRVSGILDFGDMVETPLVCDAAVAASYQIDPEAPFASLAAFARAYHETLPLTPLEQQIFPALVAARTLTSIAIASARALRFPQNAEYILRNMENATSGLRALRGINFSSLWS